MLLSLALNCAMAMDTNPPANADGLTLGEAIRMAQAHNPGYQSAVTARDVAGADYAATHGERLPRVELFGSYLYSPIEDKRLIPRALLEDVSPAERFDSQIATLGARLSYPLYTGGSVEARTEAARLGIDMAGFVARKTRQDLVLDVTRAFYDVLLIERVIEANQQGVDELEEAHRMVKALFDNGRAPRLDLLRVETRLAAVRQALIRTQSAHETGVARLRRLIGIEDDAAPLRLQGDLMFQDPIPSSLDSDALFQRALDARPAYQAAQTAIAQQRQRVAAARGAGLPQVGLEAAYLDAAGLAHGSSPRNDATLSLTLTQRLFDGGAIRSRADRENARLLQLRQRLDDLRLQIRFEIDAAVEAVREAAARVHNTETAVTSAEEALRDEQLKLESGKGIINDVLLAQTDTLQAEVEHATARADYRIAVAALARAAGQSLPDEQKNQEVGQ